VSADDCFCECCGAPLAAAPAAHPTPAPSEPAGCVDCGGSAVDPDGYCERCGRLQSAPTDHIEIELEALAGVTDKGLVHPRNEDSMALVELDTDAQSFAVVVCDGVSTSQHADQASRVAADAAVAVLGKALDDPSIDLVGATADALATAQAAVIALVWDRTDALGPPSCTYVSALRRDGGAVVTASIGDTRAYWFASQGSARLSPDDSWAADQIAGGVDPAIAEADPRAHAITHWLGVDAPALAPHVVTQAIDEPGRLLVCSDGLWNYASTIERLAPMVQSGSPLDAAQILNHFALEQGGHDNITVVVVTVAPSKETSA